MSDEDLIVTLRTKAANAKQELADALNSRHMELVVQRNALTEQLAAAQAALDGEREWWKSIREDHAEHLMILKAGSLKRLAQSPTDALEAVMEDVINDAFVDAVAWARSCSGESADAAADYIQEMAASIASEGNPETLGSES